MRVVLFILGAAVLAAALQAALPLALVVLAIVLLVAVLKDPAGTLTRLGAIALLLVCLSSPVAFLLVLISVLLAGIVTQLVGDR